MASATAARSGDGLIVPDKIPVPDLSLERANVAADDLVSSAKAIVLL